jgi:hypothetical protein
MEKPTSRYHLSGKLTRMKMTWLILKEESHMHGLNTYKKRQPDWVAFKLFEAFT